MSALSDAIKRLIESSDTLKQSDFSLQQRKALEDFARRTRLIELMKQGRSTTYRVLNRQGLSSYLKQLHPLSESDLPGDLPARSRNLGINRNSKKGQSGHGSSYLLMKAWADDVVWQDGKNILNVTSATQQFGVAALQVNSDQRWQCNRTLLFIENQALFDRSDWLEKDFDGCLIYYAGQLSDLLLHWLSQYPRSRRLILFPDYDGIGLSNYARLANTIHPETKLSFYWLPDWQNKLVRYGDAEIWSRNRVLFENAYNNLKSSDLLDSNFMKLAELSQKHGKALEQEAIWL
ncbi:MAG: hypothetical protein IBX56_04615 [Methylomicrobium sp.]|nr:hypothetical protein [Methylomicrobium sp.]